MHGVLTQWNCLHHTSLRSGPISLGHGFVFQNTANYFATSRSSASPAQKRMICGGMTAIHLVPFSQINNRRDVSSPQTNARSKRQHVSRSPHLNTKAFSAVDNDSAHSAGKCNLLQIMVRTFPSGKVDYKEAVKSISTTRSNQVLRHAQRRSGLAAIPFAESKTAVY